MSDRPPKETSIVPPAAAFQHRDFRLFQTAAFLWTVGIQMQSVAVGWQVYASTHRVFDLGLVGLAQFIPAVVLSLVTGDVADRLRNRRRILLAAYGVVVGCSLALLTLAKWRVDDVRWIYLILVIFGCARAFGRPASQALLPQLVPSKHFGSAVAWSSFFWQIAAVTGPAAGGILYGLAGGASIVYALCAALTFLGILLIAALRVETIKGPATATWHRLFGGLHYVWKTKRVLGSISLDLFAVLLGGAVALLPVYASDILKTGPAGLGLLRSAPSMGAAGTALILAFHPMRRRVGVLMFVCVALFGLATIVFGLSTNFALSLVALIVVGASDMVSVVIRQTLVQLSTPPEMRGRVSAVTVVFVGASNELGEFESGLTAAWFGVVPSVVIGGLGTLLVVGLWALLFPSLRKVDRLE